MAKGYFFTGVLALNNNGEISLFEIKPKKKTHGTNVSIYLVTHDIPPIPVTRDDVIRVAFYLENSVGTTPVRIKMAEATFYGNLIETKPQTTDGLSLRTEGAEWQFSKMYTGIGIAPGAGLDAVGASTSTSTTTSAATTTTTTTTTAGVAPTSAAGAPTGAAVGVATAAPSQATATPMVVAPTSSTSLTGGAGTCTSATTTGAVVGGTSTTIGMPLASSSGGVPGVGPEGLLSMSSGSVSSIPGTLSPAVGGFSDVATSTAASSSSSAYSGYSACSLSSSAGSSAASSASSSSSSSSTSSIASLQPFTWFLSGITARVPDQRAKEYLSLSRG